MAFDIGAILREGRSAALGVYAPPPRVFCVQCGADKTVMGYIKVCPDTLECGHAVFDYECTRCPECGWPRKEQSGTGLLGYCGDSKNGCRPEGPSGA